MTTRQVLILGLLVSLLASTNATCILGLVDIQGSLLCSLLGGLLGPLVCNLETLLDQLCPHDQALVEIALTSGSVNLNIAAGLASLNITASNSAHITVSLLNSLTITEDLSLSGGVLLGIAANTNVQVGGNVLLDTGAIMQVAGTLVVQGIATIKGNLEFSGSLSRTSQQTAWLNSSNTVVVTGTPTSPGAITGNGGVNADVRVEGQSTAGEATVQSALYFAQDLLVNSTSLFTLLGNVTVAGVATVNGRLHLGGPLVLNKNQQVWFRSPGASLSLSGTPDKVARLSGNGGIDGDVFLGDYAGVTAGNSPGYTYYSGNLQMSSNSFMEVEVQGDLDTDYDQYVIQNALYRNGVLYINFLNGYLPNANDRFNFGAHVESTGTFTSVYASSSSVQAAYSDSATAFVFSDPVVPSYCSCVASGVTR